MRHSQRKLELRDVVAVQRLAITLGRCLVNHRKAQARATVSVDVDVDVGVGVGMGMGAGVNTVKGRHRGWHTAMDIRSRVGRAYLTGRGESGRDP